MKLHLFVLVLLVSNVACVKNIAAERKVSHEIFGTESSRKSDCCEEKSLGGTRV